jgi:CRP/FNR family transcriptional regulator, cyclic AMP receptor protein
LLDADPDLGRGLSEPELREANVRAAADVVALEEGRWDPSELYPVPPSDWFGLFALDGLMFRRVTVGDRVACELFGPGDVFRPWDADSDYEPLSIKVDWIILERTRLALLTDEFVLRIARWPAISSQLAGRLAGRARYLALTQAVTHLPRAHLRLLLYFWLLAERWGTVRSDGVLVKLPLTHAVLAMLVGTQRPTVSTALQHLKRSGLLIRERPDRWLLTTQAIESLKQ